MARRLRKLLVIGALGAALRWWREKRLAENQGRAR